MDAGSAEKTTIISRKESAALQTGDTSELNMEQMSDYTNMKAFVDAKEAGTLDAEDAAQNSGAALLYRIR